jgi:hypothetical protein
MMVKSSAYPDLDRSPKKNWVEAAGGLPSYIERIAKHIHYEGGKDISTAISMAVSQVKRWAAGGGGVSAKTQALAAKAVAQWEALKGKSKARAVAMSARRIETECLELAGHRGPYTIHVKHTKQYGKKKGDLSKAADWRHPYQPRTQVAGALKAKHLRKSDLDSTGAPKPGKSDEVRKPLPASAALEGVGRKEQHAGGEKKAPPAKVADKSVKKGPSPAVLRAQRRRLQAKVSSGTATAAEKAMLNRVVAQLKSTAS